jgi:hypothetical protein
MNPEEYFKHCKNLHLTYLTQWCKYCKTSIGGFDLKGVFNHFKKDNCQSCAHHKSRSKKWICYVKWVKEQAESPEFKKVSENFKKRL